MENPFAIRIDSNAQQWGGNNLTQGEKQNRRRQKLQALLQNLKAGDLDASRMAFTALVNFDPSVSADPYLSKIGAALQSSNIHAAQHFALELQSRGAQLQSHLPVHDPVPISQPKDPWDVYSGISRIDLSA